MDISYETMDDLASFLNEKKSFAINFFKYHNTLGSIDTFLEIEQLLLYFSDECFYELADLKKEYGVGSYQAFDSMSLIIMSFSLLDKTSDLLIRRIYNDKNYKNGEDVFFGDLGNFPAIKKPFRKQLNKMLQTKLYRFYKYDLRNSFVHKHDNPFLEFRYNTFKAISVFIIISFFSIINHFGLH